MQNPYSYPTSDLAEDAFYRSFQEGDLELMMSVWSPDVDVVCVHPGASRLLDGESIRRSWEQVFSSDEKLELRVTWKKVTREKDVAIHNVVEAFYIDGELQSEVIATNVYIKVKGSWYMILHHASAEVYPILKSLYDEIKGQQQIH